jgi:hypothetical protein
MNQKRMLVLVTAAAAIAVAVLSWRSDQHGETGAPGHPIEYSMPAPPVVAAALDPADLPARVERPTPELDRMGSLSRLSATALSATEGRGQLVMELGQAIQLCTNLRFRLAHPSRQELALRAKGDMNSLIEGSKRFCDYQPATMDDISREMLALGTDDEVAQAIGLRALAIDNPTEDGVPLAERLVNTARDPVAVESAAFLLFALDRDLPQTKAVPIPASLKYREAQIDAQRLALEMYTCRVRGGCGPGGLYTMLRCQKCGTRVHSLTDMWSQQYPQDVVAYARSLSNHMAASR